MTNKQLIEDRLLHIGVLLKLMAKRITLEEYEDHQHKAIIEGRKQTFESAYGQIVKVNNDEENMGRGSVAGRKKRFSELIKATEEFITQVRVIITSEIDVDESEDDRIKNIVQGRDLALELEELVINANKDMKARVDKKDDGKSKKDFATHRAKGNR